MGCDGADCGAIPRESWDVRPCLRTTASATVGGMPDWSARILHDLNEILSNEGRRLVHHVDVRKGWGEIHHVTVFALIGQSEAGVRLEKAIHMIVGNVLDGVRHTVKIDWAKPI